jgi:hypothetical protein
VQGYNDWETTDSKHRSLKRHAETLATRSQRVVAKQALELPHILTTAIMSKASLISARKRINLLKPTGYGMHQHVEHFNNCTLFPYYIYVLCIRLRTNSDLCHLYKKLIGFYNWDEKCLQRGTDWAYKWSNLRSVF